MLVGPDDRSIDHHPFPVGFLERLKDGGPDTVFGPTIESLKDGVPVSESFREISPGCSGSKNPQDRIDEPSVVSRASGIARFPRQKVFDPAKLLVGQLETTHRKPLRGLALYHLDKNDKRRMSTRPSQICQFNS